MKKSTMPVCTPLHRISLQGKREVAHILLKLGANVNATDFVGVSPLHRAAENNSAHIIELLLTWGADIDLLGNQNDTALAWAVLRNHRDAVRCLVEHGANVLLKDKDGKSPLFYAVEQGCSKELIEILIKGGSDVSEKDKMGRIPLHIASEKGHMEAVEALMLGGSQIDTPDMSGRTPLHLAAGEGKTEIAKLLVAKGADMRAVTMSGKTPIDFASVGAHDGVIELLLACGGKDGRGETSLHRVAACWLDVYRNDPIKAIKTLLDTGADLHTVDCDGMTPLHYVSKYGDEWLGPKIAALLLDHGVDPFAKDNKGKTALDYAKNNEIYMKDKEILRILGDPEYLSHIGRNHALYAVGDIVGDSMKVQSALFFFERLVRVTSTNELRARALRWLGEIYYFDLAEYDKARVCYETSRLLFEREARHAETGAAKARALKCLGECYYFGSGVEQDDHKARSYYEQAAFQPDDLKVQAGARNALAEIYLYGYGVEKDNKKAQEFFVHAAKNEDMSEQAVALQMLSTRTHFEIDVEREHFEHFSRLDNSIKIGALCKLRARACGWVRLGDIFHFGYGVMQNYEKAEKFYSRAINMTFSIRDHAPVNCISGIKKHQHFGYEIEEDYKKAFRYYESIVEGDIDMQAKAFAQGMLQCCYEFGYGVEQDDNKSKKYFENLNNERNFIGQSVISALIGDAYFHGIRLPKNFKKAQEYFERVANQNFDIRAQSWALYSLGEIYQKGGFGIIQDFNKAREYYARIKPLADDVLLQNLVVVALARLK